MQNPNATALTSKMPLDYKQIKLLMRIYLEITILSIERKQRQFNRIEIARFLRLPLPNRYTENCVGWTTQRQAEAHCQNKYTSKIFQLNTFLQ